MRRPATEKTLTHAELQIMNVLWNHPEGATTHQVIDTYAEPRPAYSTIATFLKILTNKHYVGFRKEIKGSKTHVFFPLISREEYTRQVVHSLRDTLFSGSFGSFVRYFMKEENLSDAELTELRAMVNGEE